MFLSLFHFLLCKIQTTRLRPHPSVTSIEVKDFHQRSVVTSSNNTRNTRNNLSSRETGQTMWLIIRQLPINTGWWNAVLTLWNLAEAISLNKAIICFLPAPNMAFCPMQPMQPLSTHRQLKHSYKNWIRPSVSPLLSFNRRVTISELKKSNPHALLLGFISIYSPPDPYTCPLLDFLIGALPC